jgi:hypothetical protein
MISPSPSPTITLRPMTAADIPCALQLSQAAGGNQAAADGELRCAETRVILDVPWLQSGWLQVLNEPGFLEQRLFTGMFLGEFSLPAEHEALFAMAGPGSG